MQGAATMTDPMAAANAMAVERLCAAEPVLVDVRPAIEVVPGFTPATILTSGPPLPWGAYTGGQRRGIVGGALFEGLASLADIRRVENGRNDTDASGACSQHVIEIPQIDSANRKPRDAHVRGSPPHVIGRDRFGRWFGGGCIDWANRNIVRARGYSVLCLFRGMAA